MENERWVAMDSDGLVYVTTTKPKNNGGVFVSSGKYVRISYADVLFPALTHENSPQRIKL